jgi:predicted restriction endonuclease
VEKLLRGVVDAYLERCAACGIERRDRSRLPAFFATA